MVRTFRLTTRLFRFGDGGHSITSASLADRTEEAPESDSTTTSFAKLSTLTIRKSRVFSRVFNNVHNT
jgi:hypothetical protein